MKIKSFFVPILCLPIALGTGLTTLVGCKNNEKEDDVNAFETDPWSVVVEHANQGWKHLTEHYEINSFIGLKRTIKINNLDHVVKVIGEKEDFLADEDGQPQLDKPVALTFQFDNIISGTHEKGMITPQLIQMGNSWLWRYSSARAWLTGTEEKPSAFFTQMQSQLGDNAIKTVSKRSIRSQFGDSNAIAEKIFLPALGEIYNADQIDYIDGESYDDKYVQESNETSEGKYQGPYSYYKQTLNQDDEKIAIDRSKVLCLCDLAGFDFPYWLRTNYLNELGYEYSASWNIWYGGTIYNELLNTESIGIAPIFCI